MVEVGQLRRWKITKQLFLVVDSQGDFYRPGAKVGDSKEKFYNILRDGNIESGWGESLLEAESVAV
jgi:hypothetical protein